MIDHKETLKALILGFSHSLIISNSRDFDEITESDKYESFLNMQALAIEQYAKEYFGIPFKIDFGTINAIAETPELIMKMVDAEPVNNGEAYKAGQTLAALSAYQVAVNKIDDFFEYVNESKSDRNLIHTVLNRLTTDLERIYNTKKKD